MAVMAQRLVRSLCTDCRQAYVPDDETLEALGEKGEVLRGKTIYRAGSCANCREGYTGRLGIYELHLLDLDMQEAIRTHAGLSALRELAEQKETPELIDDALEKVADGRTSLEELHAALGWK